MHLILKKQARAVPRGLSNLPPLLFVFAVLFSFAFFPFPAKGAGSPFIAVILPEGPAWQVHADSLKKAVRLAAENAFPVRFYTERCLVDEDKDKAEEIADEKPALVLGYRCLASALEAAEIFRDKDILYLNASNDDPELTEAGLDIFRVDLPKERMTSALFSFLGKNYAGKKWAVVLDQSERSTLFAASLEANEVFRKNRARIKVVAYNAGLETSPLRELEKFKPAVVAVGAQSASVAALMMEQISNARVRADLIALEKMGEVSESVESSGLKGKVFMIVPVEYSREIDAAEATSRLRIDQAEVGNEILFNYAAVEIFLQAVLRAGSSRKEKLVPFLRKDTFQTVVGDVSFDPSGNARLGGYNIEEFQ